MKIKTLACLAVTGLLLQACSTNTEGPAGSKMYTVKEGETLQCIAAREYGDKGMWGDIYEANTNLIENPNVISPGQVIVIPKMDEMMNEVVEDKIKGCDKADKFPLNPWDFN